jgi:hemolysin III
LARRQERAPGSALGNPQFGPDLDLEAFLVSSWPRIIYASQVAAPLVGGLAPLDFTAMVRTFTRGEEIANWVTHGVGLLLSLAAFILLLLCASLRGDAWHLVSFTVYGITLIALYAASTLYHASRGEPLKALFKRLDHAAIYLLIAGTYTPFLLTQLRDPLGWTLLVVIWAVCGAGAVFKLANGRVHPVVSTTAYVIAGWLILVAIDPLTAAVSRNCIALLVAGGVCYTSGIIFYMWHRLRYHHAIWHTFVLGGSTCHFLAVLLFLVPATV